MDRFHYLGKGPLCGAQIRYLVESSRHGWVGALAFSAAQWRLKERDHTSVGLKPLDAQSESSSV